MESREDFPKHCDIWVENACGTNRTNEYDIDIVAIKIIHRIIEEYKKKGLFPAEELIHW